VPPTRHAGGPSRPWTWSFFGGSLTARPDPTPPSPPPWRPSLRNDPPGRILAGFGRGRVNPLRPEMFFSRTGSNLKSLRGSIFLDSGGWTTLLGPLTRNLASRASQNYDCTTSPSDPLTPPVAAGAWSRRPPPVVPAPPARRPPWGPRTPSSPATSALTTPRKAVSGIQRSSKPHPKGGG